MTNLKLKLEPMLDDSYIDFLTKQGETEIELYQWKRHIDNVIIQIIKSLSPEGLIRVSMVSAKTTYIPRYEEILLVKQRFLDKKLTVFRIETAFTEKDELTLPIVVNLYEYPNPAEADKCQIITPDKNIITGGYIN